MLGLCIQLKQSRTTSPEMQKLRCQTAPRVQMSQYSRVSAFGTKNKITPFSSVRLATSTSSSFSFFRVIDGKVSPMSIGSRVGAASAFPLLLVYKTVISNARYVKIPRKHNDFAEIKVQLRYSPSSLQGPCPPQPVLWALVQQHHLRSSSWLASWQVWGQAPLSLAAQQCARNV